MGGYYYDYSQYFESLVSNTNTIIENQHELFNCLSVLLVVFIILFIYIFIRNMIKQ